MLPVVHRTVEVDAMWQIAKAFENRFGIGHWGEFFHQGRKIFLRFTFRWLFVTLLHV